MAALRIYQATVDQLINSRGRDNYKTATRYLKRMRPLFQRDVIIDDYVDFEVPVLAKMYSKRRVGYKAIGYEIVLPDNKKQVSQLALEKLEGSNHDAGG